MKAHTLTIKRYIWFTHDGDVEVFARNHPEAIRTANGLKRFTAEQKRHVRTCEPDMTLETQCTHVQYTL